MSRLIQLALVGSVLAGWNTSALAQKVDPLLQISTSCYDVQVLQDDIQNRVEDCFIKDGNGKEYRLKDGESIQIWPYLFARTWWKIEKKYNPAGYYGRALKITNVQECLDRVISKWWSFEDKLTCLKNNH